MKYIGGYFELELPRAARSWHPGALPLNSGRACLAAIVRHRRPRRAHVPFFACDALSAPLREAGVEVVPYALDARLAPAALPQQDPRELVIIVDYFGLQRDLIRSLSRRYGGCLVADHTQAFFERAVPGSWSFCSARKFFGVPDGAYLYAPEPLEIAAAPSGLVDTRHLVNRLLGRQQTGYRQVGRWERQFDCRVRAMSPLSARLLAGVDYAEVRRRRRANYRALHALLAHENLFDARLPPQAVPFAYPLLLPHAVDRAVLARERLYVPTLWPEVAARRARRFAFERALPGRLLPLPVDQRYQPEDMAEAVRRLRRGLLRAHRSGKPDD